MKLRYGKHPYGVPLDDTRYDASLLRRIWWQFCDWWTGAHAGTYNDRQPG